MEEDKPPVSEKAERVASLEYAVRLAVSTKVARRVWYIPDPKPGKPMHMIWHTKAVTEPAPPMARLYCVITADGTVLHSYTHILHPFVGDAGQPFCRVCRGVRTDRIHLGIYKASMAEFFRWGHPQGVSEIPIDELYSLERAVQDGYAVGN